MYWKIVVNHFILTDCTRGRIIILLRFNYIDQYVNLEKQIGTIFGCSLNDRSTQPSQLRSET